MDASALLTLVESAITALVEGGASSYSIGQRNVTKLDLAALFEQRRILLMEVQRNASGAFTLAKIGRRS